MIYKKKKENETSGNRTPNPPHSDVSENFNPPHIFHISYSIVN